MSKPVPYPGLNMLSKHQKEIQLAICNIKDKYRVTHIIVQLDINITIPPSMTILENGEPERDSVYFILNRMQATQYRNVTHYEQHCALKPRLYIVNADTNFLPSLGNNDVNLIDLRTIIDSEVNDLIMTSWMLVDWTDGTRFFDTLKSTLCGRMKMIDKCNVMRVQVSFDDFTEFLPRDSSKYILKRSTSSKGCFDLVLSDIFLKQFDSLEVTFRQLLINKLIPELLCSFCGGLSYTHIKLFCSDVCKPLDLLMSYLKGNSLISYGLDENVIPPVQSSDDLINIGNYDQDYGCQLACIDSGLRIDSDEDASISNSIDSFKLDKSLPRNASRTSNFDSYVAGPVNHQPSGAADYDHDISRTSSFKPHVAGPADLQPSGLADYDHASNADLDNVIHKLSTTNCAIQKRCDSNMAILSNNELLTKDVMDLNVDLANLNIIAKKYSVPAELIKQFSHHMVDKYLDQIK